MEDVKLDYRRILDSLPDAVVVADQRGRIVHANRRAEALLGFGPGELAGRPLEAVGPGWPRAPGHGRADAGRPLRTSARRADGAGLEIELTLAPLTTPEGDLVVASVRAPADAAVRKQGERALAEGEARFRAIFSQVAVGVAQVDLTGQFVLVNDRYCRMTGRSREELLRMRMQDITHPDDLPRNLVLFERLVTRDEPFVIEKRYILPDGGHLWVNNSVSLVRDAEGQPRYVVAISLDVTERKRVERALRESEERFRSVFEGAALGIALVGMDGRAIQVNPALQQMLGYSEEELRRLTVADISHPEDLPADAALFAELLARRRDTYQIEKRYVRKDGQLVWALLTVSLVRSEDGQPLFATGLIQDVTEQRRAAEALSERAEQLRAIVDNSPSVIFLKDLEGRYLLMNHHSHTRLRDEPREAVIGKTDFDLFPADIAEYLRENDRQVLEARRTLTFDEYEEGENPRIFISYKFPLFRPNGTPFAVGGISTEITELKRLQTELRRRVEQLADADRRKDEFLATLAHELRNPLAAINNSLFLLNRYDSDQRRARELREIIGRQKDYLTRLVDDLLDVSRITRGLIELHLEPVDVGAIVSSAVEATRGLVEQRRHELTVTLAPERLYVQGDAVRLEQILTNLLSNAAKYTDPGGRIWLGVEHEGAEVVLRVRDTGIGIDPAILPRVFDLFTQAERSYARTHGGLGIGLHIVQRLVELHRGTVSARSEGPGRGSVFEVRLPLAAPAGARDAGGARPRGAGARPRRILIIEDNRDAAETLREILTLLGHEVDLAFTGPEGTRRARDLRPDVVVCDIGLPEMDGYAVARELRRTDETARARLIALTGFGQLEDARRAHEAGFDFHLTKPVDIDELERAVVGP